MRLFIVALLFSITLSVPARAEPAAVDFRSILADGDGHIFSLTAGDETAWVAEGDTFAGYEVGEFRPDENLLILRKDDEEYPLSLGSARVTRGDIHSDDARIDISNLRQVSQAALIFANDNQEELPGGETVETIHDVARLLAQQAGLNSASLWVSKHDAKSGLEDRLTTVLDKSRESTDPVFSVQDVVAYDFATGLHTGMPSTTPIAWTRGLREDGTWDKQGPHGSSGGFIVFMGGNVGTYEHLGQEGEGRLVSRDGTPTSNILEALPPEARVVGSGPKSLHGATGIQDGKGERSESANP